MVRGMILVITSYLLCGFVVLVAVYAALDRWDTEDELAFDDTDDRAGMSIAVVALWPLLVVLGGVIAAGYILNWAACRAARLFRRRP